MKAAGNILGIIAICILGFVIGGIEAQSTPGLHNRDNASENSKSGFAQEMMDSMTKMDHDMMAAPMIGDSDHDFVAMMIPHHQGAIDMAKSELLHGKDLRMRRLAQEIITDQQLEIELMERWLKQQPDARKENRIPAAGSRKHN